METALQLSAESRTTAGVLLLTVVAVESGGWYMLQIVTGRRALTTFQKSFARAGHAHAGVFVILALVAQVLIDATEMSGAFATVARSGIPLAAILLPAGFFFSSAGRGRERPNRLIVLVYAGMVSLAAGVVALGLGLLTA